MKWKKLETIGNKDITYSSWYTGKDIEMNMISGQLKYGYYIPKRQLETIR